MAFEGREFLDFAKTCNTRSEWGDAGFRSGISRAYYGALLTSRSYCEQDPRFRFDPRSRSSHADIINAVSRIRSSKSAAMAEDLKKLKRMRESADYTLNYHSAATDIDDAIDDAEVIIKWIDALPPAGNV